MHGGVQFFGAWSGEVGRKRPCHGEPVPIDLRFQLHQATHLEADHLGLLVAYDQQRGKPAEERHVADERKRRGTDGWRFRHELLREVAADVLTAPTTRRRKAALPQGKRGWPPAACMLEGRQIQRGVINGPV